MFNLINNCSLKCNHNDGAIYRQNHANRRWNWALTGYLNGALVKKNSTEKLIRSIPSIFKPKVVLVCIVCGGTNVQVNFDLAIPLQNLDPGNYTMDDLHEKLKVSNARKLETRVFQQIKTLFKHSKVTLQTCCSYVPAKEIIKDIDSLAVGLMEFSQPISVKNLKISYEKMNPENHQLLKNVV